MPAFAIMAMAEPPSNDAERWLAFAPATPAFEIPATREAWEARRSALRAELTALLGRLPPRPAAPTVDIRSREDCGDYVVERFEFDNAAGAAVPGVILLPKERAERAPAILYSHWHGGEYAKGKIELFRKDHTPEEPGPALVRRGYIVLAIDAYSFGDRSGHGPGGPGEKGGTEEQSATKFNLWLGRTLWGMIVRDDLMALDYLASRPEVDPERIGVTGISMGATRTWWLMAMDDRPRTGVAVCCLTRYQDLIRNQALRYHGIYYYVPGLLNHFDTEAVVSLAAPRPLLFLSGETDPGSPPEGIRTIEATAKRAYALYGKEADLESHIYPGVGHEYTPDMWQRMLAWMDARLQPRPPP
jgi:dipeptidyl aminopeptidase/acylaminoacyl peptidase